MKKKEKALDEKPDKKKKDKKRLLKAFLHFVLKLVIIGVAAYVILTYVLAFYRMSDNYMFPNIKDGDLCILYKLDEYSSNEIVLYHDPVGNLRLGRIVAIADQEVDFMEEGGYTVNGYQPSEEITYETGPAEQTEVDFPLKVEEGSVFVMNDFRSLTTDSREFGTVSKDDICGKLIFVLRRRGF